MPRRAHLGRLLPLLFCALAVTAAPLFSQATPYRAVDRAWGELPEGREWGAVSAIYPSPDGRTIWIAERCGQNTCIGSDLDPVLQFDLEGKLLRSFGAGMMAWPHGVFVDDEGNVWVTDALGFGDQPAGWGHIVIKFSPEGEVLMTLGARGEEGDGPDRFRKPSDVLVAPNGDIFVADGHEAGGNNRIVRFDSEGNYLGEWGTTGGDHGQFRDPHALAMDSQGRIIVADRANNRLQLFTPEGVHLQSWTQFSRVSGLFLVDDVLFAVDSESNQNRNPGWKRGVYIGSVIDGWVTEFIPDPEGDPDTSGTSGGEGVAVDAEGNVYTAEVGPRTVTRYERRGGG
ncbi:MAG: peptidyl-alpha-hydroxyglycine alpha-amidating lyase family protein [Gemmatimonadota bacterium]